MAVLSQDRSNWTKLEFREFSDHFCGAVYLNGEIYIIGNDFKFKSLHKLDRNLKRIELADMNVEHTQIENSCLELDGYIWVLGGYANNETLKTVERYDPKEDKWTEMP